MSSSHFITALVVALVCSHFCDASKVCGENAKKVLCGRFCEPSCSLPHHRLCGVNPMYCTEDCRCNVGYVRGPEGNCIEYEDCPHAYEKGHSSE